MSTDQQSAQGATQPAQKQTSGGSQDRKAGETPPLDEGLRTLYG
ncbi:MAG: hypothetical protein AAGB10_19120 [Pseudomonadota bacterium]